MKLKTSCLLIGIALLANFVLPTIQVDPLCPVTDLRTAAGGLAKSSLQIKNSQTPYDASGDRFPGFYDDWITLHRIGSNTSGHHLTDDAVITLTNTGSETLTVSKLTNSLPTWFRIDGPAVPFTIAAGASKTLTVTLIITGTGKLLKVGTLTVESSDSVNPSQVINLSGIFMAAPEGGHEPVAQALINAFGWNTQIGFGYNDYEKTGVELGNHSLLGELVFSRYWAPADLTKPVWAKAFVTMKHCCNSPTNFYLKGTNKVKYCTINTDHMGGQTILPWSETNLKAFAESTCTVPLNVTFGVNIAYEYNTIGNPMDFIAIHPYPVRDRNGALLPNTYMFTMDYTLRTGCGNESGQANCDNNDNMFIVTNIKPVDNPDQDPSVVYPLPVTLSFDSAPTTGLRDSTGNFIGFNNYILNEKDTQAVPGPNSFKKEQVTLDTAGKKLTIKTLSGTNAGLAPNDLPNLLVARIDTDKSFMITSKVIGGLKDTTSVGVWLGSDRDNYIELVLKGTTLSFNREFLGKMTVVGTATLPAAVSATSSIGLVLQVDPSNALSVTAGYYLFSGSNPGALNKLTQTATIPVDSYGRLFSYGAAAGIYAVHDNAGTEDSVNFESFHVVNCDGSTTPFTEVTDVSSETSAESSSDNGSNSETPTESENSSESSSDDGGNSGTSTDVNSTNDPLESSGVSQISNSDGSSSNDQPQTTNTVGEQEGSSVKLSPVFAIFFSFVVGYLSL